MKFVSDLESFRGFCGPSLPIPGIESKPFKIDFSHSVIGGWGNSKTLIRRKRQDLDLRITDSEHVLTTNVPLKALIEISTGESRLNALKFQQSPIVPLSDGLIRVYMEHSVAPIAEVQDSNPLPINYFGFASFEHSLARYFYNCPGEHALSVQNLRALCQETTATEYEYKDFFPIDANHTRNGYLAYFVVYIRADKDAHIGLSEGIGHSPHNNAYEILIGGWGRSLTLSSSHSIAIHLQIFPHKSPTQVTRAL